MKNTYMLERPEANQVLGGLSYNGFAFWCMPFIMLLLMQGSMESLSISAGMEIAYHIINFVAVLFLFGRYLLEFFGNARIYLREIWTVVWKSALLIFAVSGVTYYAALFFLDERASIGAYGALPLCEMDLFVLSGMMQEAHPVLGTICAVLLGPVTVSCLYYATVFAPLAINRPVLAYIVMVVYLAIPRACNVLSLWPLEEELILYLVQLPVHLLACRAYQKADTVWAPIALLMLVNAIASAILFVLQALM